MCLVRPAQPGDVRFFPSAAAAEAAGFLVHQVGKTLRVQRVKRLLDTTDLPMSEVALAAGFASLRRFNAVVFDVYGRSPTEL